MLTAHELAAREAAARPRRNAALDFRAQLLAEHDAAERAAREREERNEDAALPDAEGEAEDAPAPAQRAAKDHP